jgi:hypothetical protein
MLLWGTAALLPILLHLWNRRRHETTDWAAMEFLLAAIRKNARRMRLEQLLLLLVRVGILLLLALALADPILSSVPGISTIAVRRPAVHAVLVVDASYSMGYMSNDQTHYDRAIEMARQVLASGEQGDAFTLIRMADIPRSMIVRPAFDKEDVASELGQMAMLHGQADLSATLDEIQRVVQDARRDFPNLQETRVVILSDLAANTWSVVTRPDVQQKLDTLAGTSTLVVLDVGSAQQENLAITNWSVLGTLPTTARSVTFQATVRNMGSENRQGQVIEFRVDDQLVSDRHVDVAAGEEVAVTFQHRFDAPRQYRVDVRLGRDQLLEDNMRSLVVPVREAIDVLCLEGKQDAARNIALALNPNPSVSSMVRPRVVPDGVLTEVNLVTYDAVFLCNVASVTETEARLLYAYVSQGGGLAIWLGDQSRAENFERRLGLEAAEQRLLPASPREIVTGEFRFDPRDYDHPFVQPFRGFERAGLVTVPIWKYLRLEPYPGTRATVALWIGEHPVLVDESFGQGRVAMVAVPGAVASNVGATDATEWSALAVWPSFPPLVQELLAALIAGRDARRNVIVGEPLRGTSESFEPSTFSTPSSIVITSPQGRSDRVPWLTGESEAHWTFGETYRQGYYAAQIQDDPASTHWFAVNVDVRESNLTRINESVLPGVIQREANWDQESAARIAGPTTDRSLFRWCLSAVMALLLLETLLAHRQDRGIV